MNWGRSWIGFDQRLESVEIIFRLKISVSGFFIFQLLFNILTKFPEIVLKVAISYHKLHKFGIVGFFVHFDFLLQFISYFINLIFNLIIFWNNLFNLLFFFFWSFFYRKLNHIIKQFLILTYFHLGIHYIFLKHWRFILPCKWIKLGVWFWNPTYMLENPFIFFFKYLSF